MSFTIGLDLGQARDYSAIAIIERAANQAPSTRLFAVRHLHRWPLGTPYTTIGEDVTKLLLQSELAIAQLFVDATGCGRPVFDLIRHQVSSIRVHAVTITGGDVESFEEKRHVRYWRVPKRNLVGGIQVLLQAGRLRIAPALKHAATLIKELENFQIKITQLGNDCYGAWREGTHDDLVLATALACWGATHGKPALTIEAALQSAIVKRCWSV